MNWLWLLGLESVALTLVKVDVLRNYLNPGILPLRLALSDLLYVLRVILIELLCTSIDLQLRMLWCVLKHHNLLKPLVLTALVNVVHIDMT